LIKLTLDKLISQYLTLKDNKYDTKDTNRALRQAAAIGDIVVIKLLIYTRRADVNTLSPSKKTTLDYALQSENKKAEEKEKMLRLLKEIGAQTGEEIIAKSSVSASTSTVLSFRK